MLKIPEATDEHALKRATAVADRARTTTGYLNADANRSIHRWDQAVRVWKKEKGSGAAPLLAEGVLLDCLSRLHGVVTRLVSDERPMPFFWSARPYGLKSSHDPGRVLLGHRERLKS